jgi:hypothetical protein
MEWSASGAVDGHERLRLALQPLCKPLEFSRRESFRLSLPRGIPGVTDRRGDLRQPCVWVLSIAFQLFYEEGNDVEFSNYSELLRDLPETAVEPPRSVGIQFDERDQFAQPARRDTSAMQCLDAAFCQARQFADKRIETLLECFVPMRSPAQGETSAL